VLGDPVGCNLVFSHVLYILYFSWHFPISDEFSFMQEMNV